MELDNATARWADSKVKALLRDCVAWLILASLAELDFIVELPE